MFASKRCYKISFVGFLTLMISAPLYGGGDSCLQTAVDLQGKLVACGVVDEPNGGTSKPIGRLIDRDWHDEEVDFSAPVLGSKYFGAYCEDVIQESLKECGREDLLAPRCRSLFNNSQSFYEEFSDDRFARERARSTHQNPMGRLKSSERAYFSSKPDGYSTYCSSPRSRYALACKHWEGGHERYRALSGEAYSGYQQKVRNVCCRVAPELCDNDPHPLEETYEDEDYRRLLRHNRNLSRRGYDYRDHGSCYYGRAGDPVIINKKDSLLSVLGNVAVAGLRSYLPQRAAVKVAEIKADLLKHGMDIGAEHGYIPMLTSGGYHGGASFHGGGFHGAGACGVPPYHTGYTGCAYAQGGRAGSHYPYGRYPFRSGGSTPGVGGGFGGGVRYPGGSISGGVRGRYPYPGYPQAPGRIIPGQGGGYPCYPGYPCPYPHAGVGRTGAPINGRYPGAVIGNGRYPNGSFGTVPGYPHYGSGSINGQFQLPGAYPGVNSAGGRYSLPHNPFSVYGVNNMQQEMARLRQQQIAMQRQQQLMAQQYQQRLKYMQQAQSSMQRYQQQAQLAQQNLRRLQQQRQQLDLQARQQINGLNSSYRGYLGVLGQIRGTAGNPSLYPYQQGGGQITYRPGQGYPHGSLGTRGCTAPCNYPGNAGAYYRPPYAYGAQHMSRQREGLNLWGSVSLAI